MNNLVITASIPEYTLEQKPDYQKVGIMINEVLTSNVRDQSISLRCLCSRDYAGKTADELIAIINKTGTDRYDPERRMAVSRLGLSILTINPAHY